MTRMRIYTASDILEGLDDELNHDALMHGGDEDDCDPYGIPRPEELPDED